MRPIDADALVDEIAKIVDLRRLSTATLGKAIHAMLTLDLVPVVRCHACEKCTLLQDGIGFYCQSWDTDFYAPHYDVATYYCADGKRRDKACT